MGQFAEGGSPNLREVPDNASEGRGERGAPGKAMRRYPCKTVPGCVSGIGLRVGFCGQLPWRLLWDYSAIQPEFLHVEESDF